jgi:hypothetical protein
MKNKKVSINALLPKKIVNKNKTAIKSFNLYKEMADILERAYLASGRKPSYQTNTGSTLKAQVNLHGISSTQKI